MINLVFNDTNVSTCNVRLDRYRVVKASLSFIQRIGVFFRSDQLAVIFLLTVKQLSENLDHNYPYLQSLFMRLRASKFSCHSGRICQSLIYTYIGYILLTYFMAQQPLKSFHHPLMRVS